MRDFVCDLKRREEWMIEFLAAFYIIIAPKEAVAFKEPVCCYRPPSQVFICEKELCQDLDAKWRELEEDGTCKK